MCCMYHSLTTINVMQSTRVVVHHVCLFFVASTRATMLSLEALGHILKTAREHRTLC